MRNFVAKHMNTYNRSSVVLDKRNKMLDDEYEKEMHDEALYTSEGDTCDNGVVHTEPSPNPV